MAGNNRIQQFLELILPASAAWAVNGSIKTRTKTIDGPTLKKKWTEIIASHDIQSLEKIADDLYSGELQRLNMITGKGASLLATAGFAISLISISLAIGQERLNQLFLMSPILAFLFLLFTSLGVIYLVSTALSAIKVVRISQLNVLKTTDFSALCVKNSSDSEIKLNWILEKLVNIELNQDLTLKKSNWLEAAQESFIRAIFCLTTVFFVIFPLL